MGHARGTDTTATSCSAWATATGGATAAPRPSFANRGSRSYEEFELKTMRAAVIDSMPGRPAIGDVEIDKPGYGEVLVRPVACGVCHSDLSSIDGSIPVFQPPFVLGHEPAGIVESVGPDVRHLAPGDHV